MKKKLVLFICFITLCLIITGCGDTDNTASQDDQSQTETVVEDVPEVTDKEEDELLVPIMEWYELYNPNGFDTVTCLISNPNDVAIDVSYNLVFYKEGKEVSRIEDCYNSSIMSGQKDIIWANYDVPSSDDADEVRMEDIYITEAYYQPIDGSYEYVGVVDGYECFDFTFDSKPELASIWFVLYNDDNGNDKFDKGEISVVNSSYLMEQTGRASFNVDVHPYTDFEVYFTAY